MAGHEGTRPGHYDHDDSDSEADVNDEFSDHGLEEGESYDSALGIVEAEH